MIFSPLRAGAGRYHTRRQRRCEPRRRDAAVVNRHCRDRHCAGTMARPGSGPGHLAYVTLHTSHGIGARMNSNLRNLLIVALVVAVGVLGYLYYQQRQNEGRVQINLDKNGLTIQKN
jgi:hypothetical protein